MRRISAALVAIVGLVVFAACGDDDGSTTPETAADPSVVDPTSPETTAAEPSGDVTAIPFPGNSAEALAVNSDGVWVVDPIEATVTQIDPDAAEVVTTIDVPGAVDVTADDTGVWVASESQGIVPIDAATGTAGTPIDPGVGLDHITAGDGALWVDGSFEDSVVRVDPSAGTAGTPITVGAFPTYLVVGDGAVYVSNLDDRTITRIDPADDTTSEISLGEDDAGLTRGGGPIAYGGGSLWAEGTDTELCRISPDGADVECADLGTDINAISADDTRVWIAAVDGQVLQVDTGVFEVVETIETGGESLDSIAIGDGAVWVTDAVANESTVFRIDS